MQLAIAVAGIMVVLGGASGCASKSCTALGIVRDMSYDATLPQAIDASTATLEFCFGAVCDTSRLARSPNPNVAGVICEDVDGRTPNFPTQCKLDESSRKLTMTTNTVYGGHAGSDTLVVTAIEASGQRTEVLRGTVTYEDTTDEPARGACTEAWKGTFTKQ